LAAEKTKGNGGNGPGGGLTKPAAIEAWHLRHAENLLCGNQPYRARPRESIKKRRADDSTRRLDPMPPKSVR
jgi:hypothetical protein